MLDSIDLLKSIELYFHQDIAKSQCISIASILLKLCERSKKIISKFSQDALTFIIKSNYIRYTILISLIVENGKENFNRTMRQTCIYLLKQYFEFKLKTGELNNVLQESTTYIMQSSVDSCNVVRGIARNIIDHIRNNYTDSYSKFFESENTRMITVKNSSISTHSSDKKAKSSSTHLVMKTSKPSIGKARRVKIIP